VPELPTGKSQIPHQSQLRHLSDKAGRIHSGKALIEVVDAPLRREADGFGKRIEFAQHTAELLGLGEIANQPVRVGVRPSQGGLDEGLPNSRLGVEESLILSTMRLEYGRLREMAAMFNRCTVTGRSSVGWKAPSAALARSRAARWAVWFSSCKRNLS
jgi:hypothetical protein